MGSGNQIFDYSEAAELLLKRSYPEIYNGTQVGPIFIPETFLPSYTKAVDPDKFHEKLKQYQESKNTVETDDMSLKMENRAFRGAFAERIFFDELQKVLNLRSSKVVVLNGSTMISPNLLKSGSQQESDFLIINNEYRYVMSIENKYNLHSIKC